MWKIPAVNYSLSDKWKQVKAIRNHLSGNWADKSLKVFPLGQNLTGDMWWEVMHTSRYVVILPFVCVVDWLSSTSGQSHRPAFQRHQTGWFIQRQYCTQCSHSSIPPFSYCPPRSCISRSLWFMCDMHLCDWFWSGLDLTDVHMTRSAALIVFSQSCSSSSCLHDCQYLSAVSLLICLPCILLFYGEQRRKKSILHQASLESPRTTRPLLERSLANWPCFYTWFEDEETLYQIFLFFFKGNQCWTAVILTYLMKVR